jgi:ribosomal protein S18 acetylase RimI-like enzyme
MAERIESAKMLRHRPVQESDIEIICRFPQSAEELFYMFPKAENPLTFDQLKQAIDSRSDSTVVLLEDRVVGFANFYRCEPGVRCDIGNVIVAPDARGQGIGKYLIESMVQIAFTRHTAREVHLSCFNANTTGLLFYRKLGFVPFDIEERADRQGRQVALIHMKLACPA